MGRSVLVPERPQRIVSLVPSQTELLYDLGLDDRVVGITKFCVHPQQWRKTKTIVGGTKQYRFDVIDALKPDLIIGNREENERSGIEQLAASYPVWMSDIFTLSDAIQMIESVGSLTQKEFKSRAMCQAISKSFERVGGKMKARALYLIWRMPFMAAGKNTFIDEMLTVAGFENCVKEMRYPELNNDDLRALDPEVVLLSSEPYPFAQKHIKEIETVLPRAEVKLVDGEMFSWYGSRLMKAVAYFEKLK